MLLPPAVRASIKFTHIASGVLSTSISPLAATPAVLVCDLAVLRAPTFVRSLTKSLRAALALSRAFSRFLVINVFSKVLAAL